MAANRTHPHTPNVRAREGLGARVSRVALRSATVLSAARTAGVSRRAAYDRRERDPEFAQAWDDAIEESVEQLEAEAVRRAKAAPISCHVLVACAATSGL